MQMVRICVYHEYADVRHMDMFSLCYFLSFPVQIRFLVFVEDTPYGGAGEYSLHKNAAMLGVKALRLSRELRMLCGLPLHGLSDTLSPTRLVLLKARGKTLQKEYEMVKKSKK